MTKIRTALASALMLCTFIPVSAQARELICTNTLAQYMDALPQFESAAARANARADVNPLYISDVQYYVSLVQDAKQCIANLTPMTTASR
jgi:hypothetical protein